MRVTRTGAVGARVGLSVAIEGEKVGDADGTKVGPVVCIVGACVGDGDGDRDGDVVGASLGSQAQMPSMDFRQLVNLSKSSSRLLRHCVEDEQRIGKMSSGGATGRVDVCRASWPHVPEAEKTGALSGPVTNFAVAPRTACALPFAFASFK